MKLSVARVVGFLLVIGVTFAAVLVPRMGRRVTVLSAGEIHERVIARAIVVPLDGVAEVRARVDGRVLRVHVQEGDSVQVGTLLAELDDETTRTELTRREAEQRALSANVRAVTEGARPEERAALDAEARAVRHELAQARDSAERLERLHRSGSAAESGATEARRRVEIVEARLSFAEARLRQARAGGRPSEVIAARERVHAAEATIEQARETLGYARLVSPIVGVVLARRVDPGDTLTGAGAGTLAPLFDVADPSRTELRAEVEESDALRVELGQGVTITGPGGTPVVGHGRISRIGQRLERRSIGADDARVRADGMVRCVWLQVESREGLRSPWPIGHRLEAAIEIAPITVSARLPREAVRVREGRTVVSVPWGLFSRDVEVDVGPADGSFVEVRGLRAQSEVFIAR